MKLSLSLLFLSLLGAPFSRAVDAPERAEDLAGARTYKAAAGPFAVQTVSGVVFRDEKRKKDLPVFVSFPQGEGTFPIIVFSHGAGGNGDAGFAIVRHWTSHGYVVLCPTHADSIKLRRARGEAAGSDLRALLRDSVGKDENNLDRPKDVTLVLDSLDELERKVPALSGHLDRERIGVGGHSFGAYTAQLIGGATVKLGGQDHNLADARAKAILQLSGQGKDQQGLHEHSWDNFTRPLMSVTGSLDRGAQGQGPEWRRDPFKHSPPGGKYHVFIEGAHHGSFTGRFAEAAPGNESAGSGSGARPRNLSPQRMVGRGGDQKTIFEWVKQATTAFWDAQIKADATAKAYLDSRKLTELSSGHLQLFRK
ncbi:MAG: hypothetical protein M3463_11485 [Verrucomicrobiota bacterium]|nr:hypothetical protein [Verrucomicrobiota bacterium]